jgi:hypothetical protein
MRRCGRRARTCRRCARWLPTGRRRWPASAARTGEHQAEERARALEQRVKEADDLKAALDAKVAALAVTEEQLLQERTAR